MRKYLYSAILAAFVLTLGAPAEAAVAHVAAKVATVSAKAAAKTAKAGAKSTVWVVKLVGKIVK